jgi:circadian clock protein KaiC
MSDRVSGGSERLNDMLGGGLPGNGINLIIGLPGSGKTILAQQYAFHNATPERPAIYLSTRRSAGSSRSDAPGCSSSTASKR